MALQTSHSSETGCRYLMMGNLTATRDVIWENFVKYQ